MGLSIFGVMCRAPVPHVCWDKEDLVRVIIG